MKNNILTLLVFLPFLSCNNNGKDSVDIADSTNQAIQDSTLKKTNGTVIDEESASFLVKVANSGMAETQMASTAGQKAVYPAVRDFASMLFRDHSAVNEQVKSIAAQKNVSLPATISDDKQADIDKLNQMKGKNFDKAFMDMMVKNHEAGIALFEDAQLGTKDPDTRAFAGKTLPTLRMHLDSAKAIRERYW